MNPVLLEIENIRKKKGVTKKHIAEHCKKSPSWYGDIVKGRRRVFLNDIFLIAEAMEMEPVIFFEPKLSETQNSKNTA